LTLVRYIYKPARRVLTFSTIAVFSLVTVPAFTGLYFMIGKYTIHAL
jgi:hypothetical protein